MSKNSSAKYSKKVQKNWKKACKRYQSLSEEEKNKAAGQYSQEQYKNFAKYKKDLLNIEENITKYGKKECSRNLQFSKIKNRSAISRTHMKWSALILSGRYNKTVF